MTYNIELRHIKYFRAVAEELHFKRAADRLFISQPALSRQIQYLEKELEAKLFKRHNRKVELTQAGRFLYNESLSWLASVQDTLVKTAEISSEVKGTLRLGYVGSAMQNVIPKLLESFKNSESKTKLMLNELDNSEQIKQLLNDQIDFAFVRLNSVPSSLEMKTILTEQFCLVLPSDYNLKNSKPLELNQLKDEAFILFEKDYSPTYYEEVMSLFRNAGFNPKVSHSSVNALTIFKMVENGFGLAVVPNSLKSSFNMNIKFIDLGHLPQRTNLNLVWKKNMSHPLLDDVFSSLRI